MSVCLVRVIKRITGLIIIISLLLTMLSGCVILTAGLSTNPYIESLIAHNRENASLAVSAIRCDGNAENTGDDSQDNEPNDTGHNDAQDSESTETRQNDTIDSSYSEPTIDELEFDLLLDELFIENVTSSSISLNFFIANPASFGIERMTTTLGEVITPESIAQSNIESIELFERLRQFDYSKLRADQQVVFDILYRRMEIILAMGAHEDFSYYIGYIRPIVGIQVQLPVLLAEFNFRTEEDFDIYLELVADVERYFSEIIDFERERARRGFFMTAQNVDRVLEHIESFLEDRENHFMLTIFNDAVRDFDGLSAERREQLMADNYRLIMESFLPAYEYLASVMRELRGVGYHMGGLSTMPYGELFAQLHLQLRTDSDKTIAQMNRALEWRMNYVQRAFWNILFEYPELEAAFFAGTLDAYMLYFASENTPQYFMNILADATARYFPPLYEVNYIIHEVHESMQAHMSPAFYMLPAFDSFIDNVIYINPRGLEEDLRLFTMLAHEGFPGHMYQTVFFLQQGLHPLRHFITGIGYVEGWATYVEMKSYSFAGDDPIARLFQLSAEFDLLYISRIDLGVNALGWNINQVAEFMVGSSRDVVQNIFHFVKGHPLLYLPYVIGYLEMLSLLEEAQYYLEDMFDIMEFHRFVLSFGPSPFSLLHEHLASWKDALITSIRQDG